MGKIAQDIVLENNDVEFLRVTLDNKLRFDNSAIAARRGPKWVLVPPPPPQF